MCRSPCAIQNAPAETHDDETMHVMAMVRRAPAAAAGKCRIEIFQRCRWRIWQPDGGGLGFLVTGTSPGVEHGRINLNFPKPR